MIREADPDLVWLLTESSSSLFGHPAVPAKDENGDRTAMVVPPGDGGAADTDLGGLRVALEHAFTTTHLVDRLAKLLRDPSEERHLFVAVHNTGLPYSVFDGLAFGDQLPAEPPPLPLGISHLWLAPRFSPRVVLWASTEWQQYQPYD